MVLVIYTVKTMGLCWQMTIVFWKHKIGSLVMKLKQQVGIYLITNLLERVSASHFPTRRYTSAASSFSLQLSEMYFARLIAISC